MERPDPAFQLGDIMRVILNERNRTPHIGVIRSIIWHYKDACYYYYLEEQGKKISKRYLAEDLEHISSAEEGAA